MHTYHVHTTSSLDLSHLTLLVVHTSSMSLVERVWHPDYDLISSLSLSLSLDIYNFTRCRAQTFCYTKNIYHYYWCHG